MISTREIASLFFRGREGLIMMLVVYADDSADRGRENILTVGGFMGYSQMFDEAERKWDAVLKKHGLEYFKASESQKRDGQFHPHRVMMAPRAAQTFSEIVRHELGKVIIEEQLGGIAISLDMKAFRKVLAEHSDAEAYFATDPYIYMFRRLIIQSIAQMNKEHPEDPAMNDDQAYQLLRTMPIAFVFDDHGHWQEAEESYRQLQNDPEIGPRLGAISHANDKQVLPLQMADLCAYEARHQTMSSLGLEDEREEFTRMANNNAWYLFTLIREEHLVAELELNRKAKHDRTGEVRLSDEKDSVSLEGGTPETA